METPLLKRRLNPFLLISTVVVLSLLAGLSVLYQSELNDLVNTRENLSSELEDRKQKIESLETQVGNLTDIRSELNSSLENLQQEVEMKESILSRKNETIIDLRDTLSTRSSTIEELRGEIESINDTAEDLSGQLESVEEDFEDICDDGKNNLTDSSEKTCKDHFN